MEISEQMPSAAESRVAPSQLYLEARLGEDPMAATEMLSTAHLRPYASACLSLHYGGRQAHPGDHLNFRIRPGEDRCASSPQTRCLLSFLIDMENARGELVGTCDFKRVTLIDLVSDLAARHAAQTGQSLTPEQRDGIAVVPPEVRYCLHFDPAGPPMSLHLKVPPILETDIDALKNRSNRIQLSRQDSDACPAPVTTFMSREVHRALEALGERSEQDNAEEACFLEGDVLYDSRSASFARVISECIPAVGAKQTGASVTINGLCWSHYRRTRSGRGILLGEGHSHPSMLVPRRTAVFMSPSDRGIHRQFFWQHFQCTCIVSKPAAQEVQIGIWGWYNGFIIPEHEAFVFDD